jgi:hypothetical protein
VTVLTTAFETAAAARAGVLGLPDHKTVIVPHPLASCTPPEVHAMAVAAVDRVVAGLTRAYGQ